MMFNKLNRMKSNYLRTCEYIPTKEEAKTLLKKIKKLTKKNNDLNKQRIPKTKETE